MAGQRVIVPVVPPVNSFVTKDGRLCSIAFADDDGNYFLMDCMGDLNDPHDERNIPFPVSADELATWDRVIPQKEDEQRAA